MSDFGLAKVLGDARMTSASGLTGTLRYLAPERFDGITDARSDIYGLGLVLYELVVWKPAFAGSARSGLIEAILHQGIPRPRSRSAPLPAALVDIIMQACARRPASRQPDAAVLAAQLRRFAATVPSAATIHTADVNVSHRARRPVVMAALVAAVSAALLTVLLMPPPPRPPPRSLEPSVPTPSKPAVSNALSPETESDSISKAPQPQRQEPITELETLAAPALKPMPADWPPRDQVVEPGTPRAQQPEPPLEHPIPPRPSPRQDGEPPEGPPPGAPGWRPPRDAPPPGERGRRPPPRPGDDWPPPRQ